MPEGAIAAARRLLRQTIEEGRYWLTAQPTKINSLDASNVERFYETGQELVDTIVGAIECGQHVALAGPRGCGKSFCIGDAIKLALSKDLLPDNGFIKIQGNKELPRDYLIEDDITLKVNNKNVVTPERKDAPLFRFADRDPTTGRPITPKGQRYVTLRGRDHIGNPTTPIKPHQFIVLFLDEVNRFSDGVLDSLLLLLEEGEVIMAGETYRLKVVVLMTMNPPGYDSSARTLSPPLSARIGRQYRLLSPQLNVLTDIIAPPVIDNLVGRKQAKTLKEPSNLLLRRAAAVTLCCWGYPTGDKPGFEYLSAETRELTTNLAESDPTLKAAMFSLNELCHFGPDARALLDWLKAAAVAAINEATSLNHPDAQMRGRHFIATSITVLAHKVQDNFSAASRPDNTRRKEEAIHAIVRGIIDGGPRVDELLRRKIDDTDLLDKAARVLGLAGGSELMRKQLIRHGVAYDEAIIDWTNFILNPPATGSIAAVEEALLKSDLAEPDSNGAFCFSSEAHKRFLGWLSTLPWTGINNGSPTLLANLAAIAGRPAYPVTFNRYVERLRCVQDRVWSSDDALLHDLAKANARILNRNSLREIVDMIDYFWLQAEHHGASVAEEVAKRFKDLAHTDPAFTAPMQKAVGAFLVEAAGRMSDQNSRGRNSRISWRRLRELMP